MVKYSDIVKGIMIDYMHAVLEGITKNLMAFGSVDSQLPVLGD